MRPSPLQHCMAVHLSFQYFNIYVSLLHAEKFKVIVRVCNLDVHSPSITIAVSQAKPGFDFLDLFIYEYYFPSVSVWQLSCSRENLPSQTLIIPEKEAASFISTNMLTLLVDLEPKCSTVF